MVKFREEEELCRDRTLVAEVEKRRSDKRDGGDDSRVAATALWLD